MGKWRYPLLFLLLSGVCGSCMRSEDFDVNMFAGFSASYDIAMPLTHTRLTMKNLIDLKGGNFIPDDTSLLHIIYAMKPVTATFIKDVNLGQLAPFEVSIPTVTYSCLKDTLVSLPFVDTIWFDMSGVNAQVQTLWLSSVQMIVRSDNRFVFPMDMEMRFENVTDEQNQSIVYRNQTSAKANHDTTVVLQNVRVDMADSRNPFIALSGTVKVEVKRRSEDSAVYTGTLYASTNFRRMEFFRADGYLDSTGYNINGEMSIAGLGLEGMTNISFEEAYLLADLKVEGVSAPLRLTHTDVLIHNTEGDPTIVPLLPDNYDVAYPAITDDPLEKKSQESAEMVNMLIDRPYRVSYGLTGILNPENDKSQMQALQKGGNMSVGLTCDIPLHFSADRYTLSDTLVVSLDDLGDDTELNYFDVKSIVKNAFPLDVRFSLHFLDAGYNNLFSLFHEDLIAGGKIGPAPGLHVEEPTVARFEDILDIGELARAKQMHYVVVDAQFSTTDCQKVKVYVDEEKEGFADVNVGIRIKVTQKGGLPDFHL